jgi:hypothetical protein
LLVLFAAQFTRAGGGPENIALVVNQRSWASITVANHFIKWRKIPAANVVYLDWPGPLDLIDLQTFIQQILKPVFTALSERQLTGHIDAIVYSADFPWAVDARQQMAAAKLPPVLTPIGSITGMTYFGSMLLKGDAAFLSLHANHYVRPTKPTPNVASTHAFHSWYGWGPDGQLLETGGVHYALSTMLGVTSGRGNSVSEVLSYLRRAVESDGSRPNGTIYYSSTNDVRSTTRQNEFAATISELKRLGVAAMTIPVALPNGAPDVAGAMLGVADFDWGESGSKIRPGAICENLTSLGGDLRVGAQQTPLTDLLRFGAAGSSGTVVEPYSVQAKFPLPEIFMHYARGCSLAESYYQSVACPFQLLIVGDPLCQPWAMPPTVTASGVVAGQPVKGPLKLLPTSASARGPEVDRFDWFVDGVCIASAPRGEQVTLTTDGLSDGHHEIRIVGTQPDDIETQGRAILDVVTDHRGHVPSLTRVGTGPARWGTPVALSFSAPGATSCAIVQNTRVLATANVNAGKIQLDTRVVGYGPVQLRIIGLGAAGPDARVTSPVLELNVEPNEPLPARALEAGQHLTPGFIVKAGDREPHTVVVVQNDFWLGDAGVRPGETFEVTGWLNLPATDVYQFQVRHHGTLWIDVDDVNVYESLGGDYQLRMAPIAMARGTHYVRMRGKTGDRMQMEFAFGGPGIRMINGTTLQHVTK